MKKKLFAGLLALTLCLSMASCGSSDSSGGSDNIPASPWGGQSEDSTAADSSAENISGDESKAAVPAEPEDSQSETPLEPTVDPASEAEPESQAEGGNGGGETEFSADGTVTGATYSLKIGDGWENFSSRSGEVSSQISQDAKERYGVDVSASLNIELFFIYPGLGDSNIGYPTFTMIKPTYNSALKLVDIESMKDMLVLSMQQQFASQEGISFTDKGIVEYNGYKFLEFETVQTVNNFTVNGLMFVTYQNGYQYIFTMNCADSLYAQAVPLVGDIMNSLKFTEA